MNKTRLLSELHPDIEKKKTEHFIKALDEGPFNPELIENRLRNLSRIVDLTPPKKFLLLGCGPRPRYVKALQEKGFQAVGVEPVQSFVDAAKEYIEDPSTILKGAAEDIPLESNSQDIVLFNSVLEHVDSPRLSMSEIFRVTAPGGVAYIGTTNRHRIKQAEYNIFAYHRLPDSVKEGYINKHLQRNPALSNYSERPAVHWFSYSDLCKLGRDVGFAKFYSPLDLVRPDDPVVSSRTRLQKFVTKNLLTKIQKSPWLRALALTQVGGSIFMWKRESF